MVLKIVIPQKDQPWSVIVIFTSSYFNALNFNVMRLHQPLKRKQWKMSFKKFTCKGTLRQAQNHKAGSKIPTWLNVHKNFISSDKHLPQSAFTGQSF
jgi:hypothetical protein